MPWSYFWYFCVNRIGLSFSLLLYPCREYFRPKSESQNKPSYPLTKNEKLCQKKSSLKWWGSIAIEASCSKLSVLKLYALFWLNYDWKTTKKWLFWIKSEIKKIMMQGFAKKCENWFKNIFSRFSLLYLELTSTKQTQKQVMLNLSQITFL